MNIFDVLRKEANMKSWKKEKTQEEKSRIQNSRWWGF